MSGIADEGMPLGDFGDDRWKLNENILQNRYHGNWIYQVVAGDEEYSEESCLWALCSLCTGANG